jgi:uncharacterized membrane protein YcfT
LPQYGAQTRFEWVDVAKGICIVLVVLMHSTLGVEKATGSETWLNPFIEWARPFRMPDFFLISGLFLASRIDRPWRAYLDTKVAHFAYFYVLWLTIQFALKAPGMIAEQGAMQTLENYLVSYIEPFGTLWFIYLLAVFFVATKLMRRVPAWLVLTGAALLHVLAPKTGFTLLDEFSSRFVFFYTGYVAAPYIFRFADDIASRPLALVSGALAVWAASEAVLVFSGIADIPVVDLVVSYIGIGAVVALSVALVGTAPGRMLAYCGLHSIAVYLAFTVFMGPVRVVGLKLTGGDHAALIALAATLAGVAGSLLLRRMVEGTPLGFLFTRPDRFKIAAKKPAARQPQTAAAQL